MLKATATTIIVISKCHRWSQRCLIPLLGMLLLAGCGMQPADADKAADAPATVSLSGFTIPVFATADEQLSYAKSLSTNPQEKSAALNLVMGRFPNDRRQIGESRLELAYLYLGKDYRMAADRDCERALAAYEAIAREFSDLPAIRAKAYWYMAWIFTDLLEDRPSGLALYALLAEKHPEDSFSRISPVPWLKLVFPNPETKPYTADDRRTHSWAGLALLEIVRNAPDRRTQTQAFDTLWREHRHSLTTGYALKAILERQPPDEKIRSIVAEYVKGNTSNSALNSDLQASLTGTSMKEMSD
jgi:VanZ family protein